MAGRWNLPSTFTSDVIMIPRGYARVGTTPDGKEGLKMEGEVRQRGGKWRGAALPV